MKILVFSDSHGSTATIKKALSLNPNTDVALHAGDGASEFMHLSALYPKTAFFAVRGNCDRWDISASGIRDEELLTLDGHKILLTHGDRYGVKSTPLSLVPTARKAGAELVIFGHTHESYDKYYPEENGLPAVRLFNPGAANNGNYGTVEIRENGILTNTASIYFR